MQCQTFRLELLSYPINAKYNLKLAGVDIGTYCSSKNHTELTHDKKMQVEQFYRFYQDYKTDIIK